MKRSTKQLLALPAALGLQLVSLGMPKLAQAQTQSWSGVCVSTLDEEVVTIQGFQCLIGNVLSVALTLIGLAAFVMFIFASFRWMLSGGNTQVVEKSRNTATYAIIGIVVALSAFIILNLVSAFTGINTILDFVIPGSDKQWW